MNDITVGMRFDTPFEQGFTVLTVPNSVGAFGAFTAVDDDGVELIFSTGEGSMPIFPVED